MSHDLDIDKSETVSYFRVASHWLLLTYGIYCVLGFAICDDGDSILIPAPYYGAFKTDLALRMGCVTVSIELSSDVNKEFGETEPFELSVGRMQHAYLKAISEGHRIRGIILANPNNPLGNVYSKSQLSSYLEFANKYKLHVILDEIYFLSIYAPDAKMTAGLSLSGVIDPDLLHVVWGFSKDFAISGFRCGLVHTTNKELAQVLSANAYFQSVPTLMQHILQSFIQDFDWLDNIYFPTNHERLRKAKEYASRVLESIGVPCFPSKAGLYLWVDLREFVKPLNKGGELALMESFVNNGVYVTASCAFYAPEPGWFRIIFSVAADELKIGMERVREVLLRVKGQGLLTSTDEPLNDGTTVGSEEGLDDLVTKLKQQINSNDWLQENTAEKWVQENEELAAKFLEQKKNTQFT